MRIEDVAPAHLKSGAIRIAIEATLTCGTDLKVFKRGYHATMIIPPAAFGHEFSGVISEIAAEILNWKIATASSSRILLRVGFFLQKHSGESLRRFAFPQRSLRRINRRPGANRGEKLVAPESCRKFSRCRLPRHWHASFKE